MTPLSSPSRLSIGILGMALAGGVAVPAEAHIVATRLGDSYAGAAHPATDLYDVVLWLALGALAGAVGSQRGRWLAPAFPLGLAIGAGIGALIGLPVPETLVAATLIGMIGLLLAAGAVLPGPLVGLVGLAAGLCRGHANMAGVTEETNFSLFVSGLVIAGYIAVTLSSALLVAFRGATKAENGWRGIAIRALGGWIAASGLMMIGFTIAAGRA